MMSSADIAGGLTFEPVNGATLMRWSWEVRPNGALRLLGPMVAGLGRRQEQRIWLGLKNKLEESGSFSDSSADHRAAGRHCDLLWWRQRSRCKRKASSKRRPQEQRRLGIPHDRRGGSDAGHQPERRDVSMSEMPVLILNAGLSSLKYQLVVPETAAVQAKGIVERIGEASSPITDHAAALQAMKEVFAAAGVDLDTVGLRATSIELFMVDPTSRIQRSLTTRCSRRSRT